MNQRGSTTSDQRRQHEHVVAVTVPEPAGTITYEWLVRSVRHQPRDRRNDRARVHGAYVALPDRTTVNEDREWMDEPGHRDVFLAYADHLGIGHADDHPVATRYRDKAGEVGTDSGPVWDGDRGHWFGLDATSVAHEIAHWLVAPSHRRRLPNFGLGPDFADGGWAFGALWDRTQLVVDFAEEENLASALGIMLWSLLTDESVTDHLNDHGWIGYWTLRDAGAFECLDLIGDTWWSTARQMHPHVARFGRWLEANQAVIASLLEHGRAGRDAAISDPEGDGFVARGPRNVHPTEPLPLPTR